MIHVCLHVIPENEHFKLLGPEYIQFMRKPGLRTFQPLPSYGDSFLNPLTTSERYGLLPTFKMLFILRKLEFNLSDKDKKIAESLLFNFSYLDNLLTNLRPTQPRFKTTKNWFDRIRKKTEIHLAICTNIQNFRLNRAQENRVLSNRNSGNTAQAKKTVYWQPECVWISLKSTTLLIS